MEILDVIRRRYSVREYQDKPIPEEKLLRILEAARLAPSARNIQEWRFVVVKEPSLRKELSIASNNQAFVAGAPVILVCCAVVSDYVMRCGLSAYPVDLSIAVDHISLQAVAEGLGSCWIGSFYPEQVKKILFIPEKVKIVALLTLGYPTQKMVIDKNRLPLYKIYSENKWEEGLNP